MAVLVTSDEQPIKERAGPFITNTLMSISTAILKTATLLPIAEGILEFKWLWFATPHIVTEVDDFDMAGRGP